MLKILFEFYIAKSEEKSYNRYEDKKKKKECTVWT